MINDYNYKFKPKAKLMSVCDPWPYIMVIIIYISIMPRSTAMICNFTLNCQIASAQHHHFNSNDRNVLIIHCMEWIMVFNNMYTLNDMPLLFLLF